MNCSDLEDFSRSLLKIVNVNLAMKLKVVSSVLEAKMVSTYSKLVAF